MRFPPCAHRGRHRRAGRASPRTPYPRQGGSLPRYLGRSSPWLPNPLGFDLAAAQRRSVPASTFKIASTLAALEAELVTDADTILPWDGVRRDRKEINGPYPCGRPSTALPSLTTKLLVARARPRDHGDLPGARERMATRKATTPSNSLAPGPPSHLTPGAGGVPRGPQPERPRSGFRGPAEALGVDGKTPSGAVHGGEKTGWSRPAGGPDVGWFVGALDVPEGRCFVALRLEAEHPQAATFLPQREALAKAAIGRIPGCGG